METIFKCSDCGGTLEQKYEDPKDEWRLTSWWCPKCQMGREQDPDKSLVMTIDMHATTETKFLAARLVPRAGLTEIQPLKVCDTGDEAGNVVREAATDPAYLYAILTVYKKRGT